MNIEHLLVLAVAGLFILGPERLPEAAAWLGQARRKARDFATGARTQLQDELGPEFDQLRRPLQDLAVLRTVHPATAVTRLLFDEDTSPTTPDAAAAGVSSPAVRSQPLASGERAPFDIDAT